MLDGRPPGAVTSTVAGAVRSACSSAISWLEQVAVEQHGGVDREHQRQRYGDRGDPPALGTGDRAGQPAGDAGQPDQARGDGDDQRRTSTGPSAATAHSSSAQDTKPMPMPRFPPSGTKVSTAMRPGRRSPRRAAARTSPPPAGSGRGLGQRLGRRDPCGPPASDPGGDERDQHAGQHRGQQHQDVDPYGELRPAPRRVPGTGRRPRGRRTHAERARPGTAASNADQHALQRRAAGATGRVWPRPYAAAPAPAAVAGRRTRPCRSARRSRRTR